MLPSSPAAVSPASSLAPEVEILSNPAALQTLKRPQLVELCKMFGIKAAGKNVDLIKKLQMHGEELQQSASGRSGDMSWSLLEDDAMSMPLDDGMKGGVHQDSAPTIPKSASAFSLSSTASTVIQCDTGTSTSPFAGRTSALPGPRPDQAGGIYPSLSLNSVAGFSSPSASATRSETRGDAISDGDDGDGNDSDDSVGDFEDATSRSFVHSTAPAHGPPKGTTLIARLAPSSPPAEKKDSPVSAAVPAPFIFGSPFMRDPNQSRFTFSAAAPSTSVPPRVTLGSPFSFASSHDHGIKTASELVMEEMARRADESRKALGGGGMKRSASGKLAAKEAADDKDGFGKQHKRVFDRMDSITAHYAAKRHAPSAAAAALSRSTSSRALATSTGPSSSTTSAPATKRVKLATSQSSSTFVSLSKSLSRGNLSDASSKDRDIVSGLVKGGFAASTSKKTDTATFLTTSNRESAADDGKARKSRQLELLKARRKIQAKVSNAVKDHGSRKSGGVTDTSNSSSTSRFLKSTYHRLTTASSTSTGGAQAAAASTSVTTSKSAMNWAKLSVSPVKPVSPALSMKTAQPPRKKFDLQASLARPLSWQPNLKPTRTDAAASRPTTSSAGASLSHKLSRKASPCLSKAPTGNGRHSQSLSAQSRVEEGSSRLPIGSALDLLSASEPRQVGSSAHRLEFSSIGNTLAEPGLRSQLKPSKKVGTGQSTPRKTRIATASSSANAGRKKDMGRVEWKARQVVAKQKARAA